MRRIPTVALVFVAITLVTPHHGLAAEEEDGFDIRSADGKVLIASKDIVSYEWSSHTLTLKPGVRAGLPLSLTGVEFCAAVRGKTVYRGKFVSLESSFRISTPVIIVDEQSADKNLGKEQIRIKLGYPGPDAFKGKDPRPAESIYAALKAGARLK
jgi:hypothetical protein